MTKKQLFFISFIISNNFKTIDSQENLLQFPYANESSYARKNLCKYIRVEFQRILLAKPSQVEKNFEV